MTTYLAAKLDELVWYYGSYAQNVVGMLSR